MCRQIIVIGNGGSINSVRIPLIRSLIKSSRYDPHSIALFGSSDASHSDGWGIVRIILTPSGVERVVIERSSKPIYEDAWAEYLEEKRFPEEVGVVEMIHARAASSGIVDIRNTHPIETSTRMGYRLFLVHNGSVDKLGLLKRLGIDGESSYAKIYSDTYFLAQLMASLIEYDISKGVVFDVARYTRTALNIGAILVKDREIQMLVGSYYKVFDKPIERRNYYKMYRAYSDSLILYTSSTLIDFYKPEIDLEWIEMPNGFFEIHKLKFGEKFEIEKVSEFLIEE
ncbi:MAG: hypothetical protein QXJ56_08010 [Ignisphaera sp.]|uniref:Glutamine amidotransferase type-2 domain-containing protein n=1 Tax=Ignisphaera aggregans TaxID=334771 RepID=A0A7J3JPX8_9CREN